jgi:nitroreductase
LDAYEAIMTRRSIGAVTDARPERADIEALLDAAVRAPTHHLTEPWRFIVLAGPARQELGEVMGRRVCRELAGDPRLEERVRFEESRPLRAPVILTVVYTPSSHPKAIENEDRYAMGAAMQNVLLAAHARGLAGFLQTGPAAGDPAVAKHLGLAPGEEIAGFIYLGHPAPENPPPPKPRTAPADRTIWKGWE